MIGWRDRFDMVVNLCFTGNKSRVPELDEEFRRVELPVDLRMWNVPSPFEDRVVESLPDVVRGMRVSAGFRNSGFGHYRAVKLAHELGARRVLVVEDDVRFLNDLDALGGIVASAPDEGLVLFDLLRAGKDDIGVIRQTLDSTVVDGWAVPTGRPCSFACYGMDRQSMKQFIDLVESALSRRTRLQLVDHYIHDRYWNRETSPIHVAWPLAAVQKAFFSSQSNTNKVFHGGDNDGQYRWYQSLGVRLSDYAL